MGIVGNAVGAVAFLHPFYAMRCALLQRDGSKEEIDSLVREERERIFPHAFPPGHLGAISSPPPHS